jgi:hypothetical protein
MEPLIRGGEQGQFLERKAFNGHCGAICQQVVCEEVVDEMACHVRHLSEGGRVDGRVRTTRDADEYASPKGADEYAMDLGGGKGRGKSAPSDKTADLRPAGTDGPTGAIEMPPPAAKLWIFAGHQTAAKINTYVIKHTTETTNIKSIYMARICSI